MDDKNTDHSGYEHLSQLAQERPRDEQGHFIPLPDPKPIPDPSTSVTPGKNILSRFFHDNSAVSKTTDDNTLIDVHIGNPLRRISQLLEDIKNQKAFTFNVKGSLGLAGILLVLTTFGIFGGTRALCNKGEQSRIGRIMQLNLPRQPEVPSLIQRAQNIWNALTGKTTQEKPTAQNRLVLIQQDQTVFHILGTIPANILGVSTATFILTGDIDNCSQTITVKDPKAIQEHAY